MELERKNALGAKPRAPFHPVEEAQSTQMHSPRDKLIKSMDERSTPMDRRNDSETTATHSSATSDATSVPFRTRSSRLKTNANETIQIPTPSADPATDPMPEELQVTGRRHRKFGDFEDHWKYFDDEVQEENEDFVDGLKANLDNLLIFAGLFSAINSGFFFLSVPRLSDNSPASTNGLLVHLIRTIDNSTSIPPGLIPSPFEARTVDIRINSLFSTSLTLSLLAAFGSLLSQQWLIYYKRLSPGARDGRRWDRERKFDRAKHWGLEGVIETALPTLLQVALLVFLVGFISFLRDLSQPVALFNLILIVVGATLLGLSIVAALCDPFCPFQAPLTGLSRFILYRTLSRVADAGRNLSEHFHWEGHAKWFSRAHVKLQQLGSAVEVLQVEAVRRILENSGNAKLLFTTAVNLPLLDKSQLESLFPPSQSPDPRLLELWNEADKDSHEEAVYSRTIVHLYLTLPSLPAEPDDWCRKIFFILSTRIHLRTPRDTLSTIPSSLACTISSYLATPESDRTPSASCELRFLREAIAYDRMRVHGDPASALGMVAWLIVARSKKIKMLQNELWRNDMTNSMFIEGLDDTEKGARIWSWTRVLRMTKKAYQAVGVGRKKNDAVSYVARAIEAYSPEDPVAHELVLSLISGAQALTEEDGLDFDPQPLIIALGSLFVKDEGQLAGGGTDQQWEEVVAESSLLMKSLFDGDKDREHQVIFFKRRMSTQVVDSPKAMEALTHYVKAMLRRPKPNHDIMPDAKRFLLFIRIVHDHVKDVRAQPRMDKHTKGFVKTIALLPEECFRSENVPQKDSDELRAWVLEVANAETNRVAGPVMDPSLDLDT